LPKIVIVIPTFNPSQLLLSTLSDIDSYDMLANIKKIIVNDGSEFGQDYLFEAKKHSSVEVIQHDINRGKGEALKTAIKYLQASFPDVEFMITMDSDRQHLGQGVVALLESIDRNGEGLHIGTRKLAKDKTPLRSFIGNLFSRKFFSLLFKIELKDTQSGLRAYPKSCFSLLLGLKSHRFEFEMEAIIAIILQRIKIFETPIETIYFNKNRSSHFRPLIDSFKVIWVIIRMRLTNK
jgi:glycosyltransferase involved in cell wall biosynthesis